MVLDYDPVADNEVERIHALDSYQVLDTLPERDYDAITRLASYICQAPIALISLIDVDRQWFKSKVGLQVFETPRTDAFCRYTIMSDEIMEIPDALENKLFVDNVLVTGEPKIRFYAGAPLVDHDGYRLGSLCVIDSVPRTLTFEQRDALQTLSREVISHLTLRKQKRELQESLKLHNEFYSLFNNSPDIHCIMNRQGNIEMINDTVTRVLGYSPQEAVGKPMWDFFHDDDIKRLLPLVERGLSNKRKTFEIEARIPTRNKETKWISWSVIAKNDNWYASGRDITYQKQVVAELEQLSLVASKVNNGVVISGADNKVLWINEAFEHITGFNLTDLKDNHLGDVIKGELTDLSVIDKAREHSRAKQSFEVDLLIYRKDGQQLWVSVINSIVLDGFGNIDKYVEVVIDITAKKKAEQELIAAKEQALQLNTAKDMFISVMNHEIRTPLNAVIGVSNILLEDNYDAAQKENLNILKFSADNLMTLINNVLDFTKAETGNIELEKINVDLRDLVNSVVNSLKFKAEEKGIYLRGNIDKELPVTIIGDKTRICQILLNLVGNSVKFTQKGGIIIDLKVTNQTDDKVTVRFDILDTGIGIAADKISSVFDSFKQADANINRLYGGTGLGLAITKRIVELYGSAIKVESLYGQGTKFSFTITFDKGNSILSTNMNETKTDLKLNVLVVDDNHINRLLIDKILKKWGITADFAENGLIAVNKIEGAKKYDVVLMDIHMPEMNGMEATRAVRQKPEPYFQQLPIIALTASVLNSQTGMLGQSGMNGYILKPFDQKTLYDKISVYAKE